MEDALDFEGLSMKVRFEYCAWRRVKSALGVTVLPSELMLTRPYPPKAGK